MKILIIPDVHGRCFWRDAIKKVMNDVDVVVFLGDYVDPYDWEGVDVKTAINEFRDIISLASENKNKVRLLLGNHDFHYINETFYRKACGGRVSQSHYDEIKKYFVDNLELFNLSCQYKIGEKMFLFSHAGVTYDWFNYRISEFMFHELNENSINMFLKVEEGIKVLCDIGYARGGFQKYGSVLWADVSEHESDKNFDNNIYQIFGHSQQESLPIIRSNYACLDVRRPFLLHDYRYILDMLKERDYEIFKNDE